MNDRGIDLFNPYNGLVGYFSRHWSRKGGQINSKWSFQ